MGVPLDQVRHLLEAAGIPVPEGPAKVPPKRSRKANRHARPEAVPFEPEPAGTVLCAGSVPGRAIPWKAPNIGRNGGVVHGRDYKRYEEWKQTVAANVRLAMRRRKVYGGPVDVVATFYLRPIPGRTLPDRDNLIKAFTDALQGVVIVNDVQVCGGEPRRVVSAEEAERVEFSVIAL
jgi:Holliday junction resolvase RusA-like endonuclease